MVFTEELIAKAAMEYNKAMLASLPELAPAQKIRRAEETGEMSEGYCAAEHKTEKGK